jgi:hypothetical protein
MAVRERSRNSDTNGSSVKPYWKRLTPTIELEYGKPWSTNDGEKVSPFEVTVYDDRKDVGQRTAGIVMQVRKTGKWGKTVTLIFLDTAELSLELGVAAALRGMAPPDVVSEVLDDLHKAVLPALA